MFNARATALDILSHNTGFADPRPWVDYALRASFKKVEGTAVLTCPDCGSAPASHIGQYVYYSTLLRLAECGACHLIWSDVRIDPAVMRAHFEAAYQSREYFVRQRRQVFEHLAQLIDQKTPHRGRVLDIGGAHGDLMHRLVQRRPDVSAVVHDISENSVRFASETFGMRTICGDFSALERHPDRYDVVVASDVLYYEPRIAAFWKGLPHLVAPGGSVVLRVPNKLRPIRAYQSLLRMLPVHRARHLQARVRFFNVEHMYVMSREYLASRLTRAGFGGVSALPSPLLLPARDSAVARAAAAMLYRGATVASRLTAKQLLLTPSMVLVATRAGGDAKGRVPDDSATAAAEEDAERVDDALCMSGV